MAGSAGLGVKFCAHGNFCLIGVQVPGIVDRLPDLFVAHAVAPGRHQLLDAAKLGNMEKFGR